MLAFFLALSGRNVIQNAAQTSIVELITSRHRLYSEWSKPAMRLLSDPSSLNRRTSAASPEFSNI